MQIFVLRLNLNWIESRSVWRPLGIALRSDPLRPHGALIRAAYHNCLPPNWTFCLVYRLPMGGGHFHACHLDGPERRSERQTRVTRGLRAGLVSSRDKLGSGNPLWDFLICVFDATMAEITEQPHPPLCAWVQVQISHRFILFSTMIQKLWNY